MNALTSCPFCASKRQSVKQDAVAYLDPHSWIVLCQCGACGPNRDSRDDAISAWNARGRHWVEPEYQQLMSITFPNGTTIALTTLMDLRPENVSPEDWEVWLKR